MSAVLDFHNDDLDADFIGVDLPDRPLALARPPRHLVVVPVADAADLGAATWLDAPAISAAPQLRLTARGRLVAGLTVLIVALGVLLAAHLSHPATTASTPASVPAAVSVQPGDTLWSIAARVEPAKDPRRTVELLRQLNHLSTVELSPGQVLRLH
jgi:LysM repeat protein